jgi:hypothetical protein
VTQPLPNTREDSRGLTEPSVNARILALAADGLRVRDIASILHVHPLIVQRALSNAPVTRHMGVTEPLPNRSEDDVMTVFRAVPSQS